MCELRTRSQRDDASASGGLGTHPCQSHMWLLQHLHILHGGRNLNICRGSTSKVPERDTRSPGGRPESAACHLLCASLTFCLSLHECLIASSLLPAPSLTPSPPLSPTISPSLLLSPPLSPSLTLSPPLSSSLSLSPPLSPPLALLF